MLHGCGREGSVVMPAALEAGGRCGGPRSQDVRTPLLRILAVGASFGYVGALLWSYQSLIAPFFGYEGAIAQPSPDGSLLVAILAAVLPATWLPLAITRPSQVALWVLYLLAYVPSVVIPYLVLGTGFGGISPLTLSLVLSFGLLSLAQQARPIAMFGPVASGRRFENGLLATALALGAYLVLAFGIRVDLPSLEDVYSVRSMYTQAASSGLPFAYYVVDWSLYVANPMLMLVGVRSRRVDLVLVGAAVELLGYSITGFKSALFSVILVVPLVALLGRRQRGFLGVTLPLGSLLLILGSAAADSMTNSLFFTSTLVRRLITLPGQLMADYYQFFFQNPTYELRHSILSFLGPAPFSLGPPNVIGGYYFGSFTVDANASVWADGLANFGLIGIPIMTLGLAVILWILDGVSAGRDLKVTGGLAFLVAITLANSGLLTTTLSHGLGFALVLLFLMPARPGANEVSDGGSSRSVAADVAAGRSAAHA